jgi:hypothetical protein
MHRKALQTLLTLTLMFVLSIGLVVGCAQSVPTVANKDLTASQAAEIIYHDLSHHGVSVGKVSVTNLTFSDRNTAVAAVTYVTAEGKNVTQKVTLQKISGQWVIPDHQH